MNVKELNEYIREGILNRNMAQTLNDFRVDVFYAYSKDVDSGQYSFWGSEENEIKQTKTGLIIDFQNPDNFVLSLSGLPAGKCPNFNIEKINNDTTFTLIFEIHGQGVTSLEGLFVPNCKFTSITSFCFELRIDELNLEDLSALPRNMKRNMLVTSVDTAACKDVLNKIEYKDWDDFLEPYKKYIDSMPTCREIYFIIHFNKIYASTKNKIKIGGEKVGLEEMREQIQLFCMTYSKKSGKNISKRYCSVEFVAREKR